MQYDYLIVGAGLYGSIFAHEMHKRGKRCLVVEKRNHIGGNIYTKEIEGIQVHHYGAHIFHTSNKRVWDYMQQFTTFNHYVNSPIAVYKDEVYNLPFNMNTFNKMWGVKTPLEAQEKIKAQIVKAHITTPHNLEEQAISLVGEDIYKKLVKGYTEKQWGIEAKALPAFIIKRLPVRFTYDNNYFNDLYQGIPIGGYTKVIAALLEGIEVRLNTDFLKEKDRLMALAKTTVFTGMIDAFYDYCYGKLGYRSLNFEHELLEMVNYQGNAVVNYTEREVPYTRIIEHKHFEFGTGPYTIITREYPVSYQQGREPYYPINNEVNNRVYQQYALRAEQEKHVIFGGRLAEYKYYDMHQVVEKALAKVDECNGC